MASKIEGNQVFTGSVTFQSTVGLPSETISAANVRTAAGIEATKLQHQHQPMVSQSGTAVADTRAIHHVHGAAGTVEAFRIGLIAACSGNATVTADLKKNGTSILSAPIQLTSSEANYEEVEATISTPAVVAGDVLTCVVTVNAGSGALGTGFYAQAVIRESAD